MAYTINGPKWGSSSQYGTSGGVVTWSFAEANYSSQEFNFDYRISDEFRDAVRKAFAKWETVCNIDFLEVKDAGNVDIRLGMDAIDGVSNTMGQCYWESLNNIITKAEIRFDTAEHWIESGSGASFYSVALHEIGHAIGLGHVGDSNQLMYAFTGSADLQSGDIAGARYLYGFTSPPPPPPEPDTNYVGSSANELFDLKLDNDLIVRGGGGDDFIWTWAGNDTLYGGTGRDVIVGAAGNDVIYGDDDANSRTGGADQLLGNWGNDTIYGGAGNDYIHGEWDDDLLYGNAGNDLIYGGFGSDTLEGGAGNDVLWGGTPSKLDPGWFGSAIHLDRDGVSGIDVDQHWTIAGEVQAADASADILKGGGGKDLLVGGGGADKLSGGTGNDTLRGGGGNDKLNGGKGKDKLIGGAGQDTLKGGKGADKFVFKSLKDSPDKKTGWDVITDFSHGQNDIIHLKAIDAKAGKKNQAFTFIGKDEFAGKKGQLRYEKSDKQTFVYGDVDGDGKADFAIKLKGSIDLVKSDFVL